MTPLFRRTARLKPNIKWISWHFCLYTLLSVKQDIKTFSLFPLPVSNFNFLFKDIFCFHELISLILLVVKFSTWQVHLTPRFYVNALSVPLLTKFHFYYFSRISGFLSLSFTILSLYILLIMFLPFSRLLNDLLLSISKYALCQFRGRISVFTLILPLFIWSSRDWLLGFSKFVHRFILIPNISQTIGLAK